MKKYDTYITIQDVLTVFFHRLPLWVVLFILAGAAVITVQYLTTDNQIATAVVNFSYDGIESGFDPSGNKFDEGEIKSEEMIRRTAAALAHAVSTDDVEAIQRAIEIRGIVPNSIFRNVIEYQSIYGEDEVQTVEKIREAAYFPSQYTIVFHYGNADFPANQATLFLSELISSYEHYFYERYGYNNSLESSVSSIDYEEYDYINAVDILNNRLTSLRAYLSDLAEQDNTRFVSSQTGYSFSDLTESIDTIRNEDISWVTSYIISNNITKNKQDLIDYYLFKIEDAERELAQRESRLYTLNTQIEGYVKTNAVFLGIADPTPAGESGIEADYEFSQHSGMYDSLIGEKVSCETAISETKERIALYQQRAERLQASSSLGDSAVVDVQLERINGKIIRFLEDTHITVDEFFRTIWLKRAFQVLKEPESAGIPITGLLMKSLPAFLIAETALFGLLVLRIPGAARRLVRQRASVAADTGKEAEPPLPGSDGISPADKTMEVLIR